MLLQLNIIYEDFYTDPLLHLFNTVTVARKVAKLLANIITIQIAHF